MSWATEAAALWLAANVVSILGCLFLLCKLSKLPPEVQWRIFPRQLWLLACADIVFHGGAFALNVVHLIHNPDDEDSTLTWCIVTKSVDRLGCLLSATVETHIALSFAAQCFRRIDMLAFLAHRFRLLCSLGGLAAVLAYYPDGNQRYLWDERMCDYRKTALAEAVYYGVCFLLSAVAYVSTTVHLWSSPSAPRSVAALSLRRALLFPLNFLVTYLPIQADFWILHFPLRYPTAYVIAWMLMYLNGFGNTCVYFLLSRYSKLPSGRHTLGGRSGTSSREGTQIIVDDPRDWGSFHVELGASEFVGIEGRLAYVDDRMEIECSSSVAEGKDAPQSSSAGRRATGLPEVKIDVGRSDES